MRIAGIEANPQEVDCINQYNAECYIIFAQSLICCQVHAKYSLGFLGYILPKVLFSKASKRLLGSLRFAHSKRAVPRESFH